MKRGTGREAEVSTEQNFIVRTDTYAEPIARNVNTERTYKFELPQDNLPASYHGELIRVSYSLHVDIRHDAWNDFGNGSGITLPIDITALPKEEITAEQTFVPTKDWRP